MSKAMSSRLSTRFPVARLDDECVGDAVASHVANVYSAIYHHGIRRPSAAKCEELSTKSNMRAAV